MESKKRKPLSDLTNTYNLIPTSTLRKFVASSSGSDSVPKPPLSIFKSNSSSTNQKLCSESSNKSDTSVGSSNVSSTRNSRTVQFRTPPRAISSITSLGGLGIKDAAHNQKQITEKSKKGREVVISSPTPVEKRKDKGKAIAVPFSSPSPEKMTNDQNDVGNHASPRESKKQNTEANLSLNGGPVDIIKDSDKRIPNSYGGSYEKTGIGKAILNSYGCAMSKQEGMKGISNHSSCSIETTNDGKKGILKHSGSSTLKTKDIGKEFVDPSSFVAERTKEKGKLLNPFNSSHEKAREKGKAILQPSDTVEITKHKGASAPLTVYGRLPRTKNEKRKNDAGSSSCPPMTRTKNIQNDLDEARESKSSKSWTDPHHLCRKKRCARIESFSELPLDFIEQQRAYFKEVDEFELEEEEVSQDELEKE